jgi:hypothetical protein
MNLFKKLFLGVLVLITIFTISSKALAFTNPVTIIGTSGYAGSTAKINFVVPNKTIFNPGESISVSGNLELTSSVSEFGAEALNASINGTTKDIIAGGCSNSQSEEHDFCTQSIVIDDYKKNGK